MSHVEEKEILVACFNRFVEAVNIESQEKEIQFYVDFIKKRLNALKPSYDDILDYLVLSDLHHGIFPNEYTIGVDAKPFVRLVFIFDENKRYSTLSVHM